MRPLLVVLLSLTLQYIFLKVIFFGNSHRFN
jgi:hypothetical protein